LSAFFIKTSKTLVAPKFAPTRYGWLSASFISLYLTVSSELQFQVSVQRLQNFGIFIVLQDVILLRSRKLAA